MYFRILAAAAVITLLASADTLTLRNGRVVEGEYLGGNSRQIRMAVSDRVETFDVTSVANLKFDMPAAAVRTAPATDVQPTVAAAPPVQTAPVATSTPQSATQADTPGLKPRVMRPDPVATTAPASTTAANEIPSGTPIVIRMIDGVDSEVNNAGQTFRAAIDEPVVVNGRTVIPAGADVVTKLVQLEEPGALAGGGKLTLDLESVTVNGKLIELKSESVTQAGRSRKSESGQVIGGTAALGAIIGAIAGGGKGAAIGAVSGAGAGTAVAVLTSGARVRIPSETRLTFTLQQPVGL